ncbi:MAG: hypothetical protein ABSB49_03125 [Polyangia bacterium]|jgi:hypothetical protein
MLGLLVISWLATADGPVGEKSVWVLQSPGWVREETALLHALRIYTRDLRVPISLSLVPSASGAGRGEGERPSEGRGRCWQDASLVAWFEGDAPEARLAVLSCASGEEYRFPLLPARDLGLAAQTLALKIRGLLTDLPARPPAGGQAQDDELARDQDELAPGAGNEEAVSAGRSGRGRAAGVSRRAPYTLEGGLDWVYGVTNAVEGVSSAGRPQGLLVRFAVASAQRPFALEVSGAFVTSVTDGVAGYQLTVTESPIAGLALLARSVHRWWTLAGGPEVSVHRISAAGFGPDGRGGSSVATLAGLGAVERVMLNFSRTVSFGLSASNEVLVPRDRFSFDGRTQFEVGLFHWLLSAGIVVRQ